MVSWISPCASFAQDAAENGSAFSFKSLLSNIFSSSSSSSNKSNAPDSAVNIPNNIVDHLVGQTQSSTQNQMPQNNMAMQAQQRTLQEGLVRCMYLGKFVEINTSLSEQDADAQIKAKRAGELYANLKCNQQLAGYEHVWKNIDTAIGNCMDNDDCQTLNPLTGNTLSVPAPSAGGIH